MVKRAQENFYKLDPVGNIYIDISQQLEAPSPTKAK